MSYRFPTTIKFRGTNSCVRCGHCGKIWREPEGMTHCEDFLNLSVYNKIDMMTYKIFGKRDYDTNLEIYVKEKYAICPFCGNFGESLTEDNYTEDVEKENLEQIYLYMYNKKQDFESLVDVYRYYEYKKDYEKSKYYRTKIIGEIKKQYENKPSIMYYIKTADLYRRNEEYDKALQIIKEGKRFSKKDETEIDSCNFHDHKKLLTEIKKLCKQKDSKAY